MRGETRVWVRRRELGGGSLAGMALPQACALTSFLWDNEALLLRLASLSS